MRRRLRLAEFIALLRLLDGRVLKGQVIQLLLDPVRRQRSAAVAVDTVRTTPGSAALRYRHYHAADPPRSRCATASLMGWPVIRS